jgi:hypothetical protein
VNYAAAIAARLGVDTKPFSTGMNQAAQDGKRAGDKISEGVNRADRSMGSLLKSGPRVAHQISNFSQQMVGGADATQLFAGALNGLERSLKLPLGSLAGLAVLGVVISKMDQANDAAINFSKGCKNLGELGIDALDKKMEEAADLNRSGFGKFVRMLTGAQQMIEQSIVNIAAARERALHESALGLGRDAYVSELGNAGDSSGAKRQKLADKQKTERESFIGKQDQEVIEAILRKQEAERKTLELEIAQEQTKRTQLQLEEALGQKEKERLARLEDIAAQKKQDDRAKLSLGELAAGPTYADQNHASLQAIYASTRAREAQGLDEKAKDQTLNQADLAGAGATLNQSDTVRNGIETLKDSDKTTAFKSALAVTEASLASIVANTAKPIVNR